MSTSIQNPLSSVQFQANLLQALADSGITQFAAGGKARAYADIVADQLGKMEARAFINLGQTLLPYANGQNLDLFGEIYDTRRLSAQTATAQSSDQNFRWYVRSGTFGDINNGQDIVIPANVQISTVSGTPVYLSTPVTCPSGASFQSFAATCSTPGSDGNAQVNQLTAHNFTGYAQSLFGSLLVTNQYGVVGGTDAESDDNYRTRISLKLQSPSGANDAALRFAILQVPGVQDVVLDTVSSLVHAYLYSVVPQPAASLLQNVQTVLNSTIAYPGRGLAVAPDLVGISLNTTVKLQKNLSSTDQANVLSSAVAAVQDYIDNLGIDNPLVLNEIGNKIFNSDARIIDVGQPNSELRQILIWRSRADGSRYSRYLIANYQPEVGERIVVETNPQLSTPINLTAA